MNIRRSEDQEWIEEQRKEYQESTKSNIYRNVIFKFDYEWNTPSNVADSWSGDRIGRLVASDDEYDGRVIDIRGEDESQS